MSLDQEHEAVRRTRRREAADIRREEMSTLQEFTDTNIARQNAKARILENRPANVRPAYQNTSDAMGIAAKALQLAASNARMEGAPPALIEKLNSWAARIACHRLVVMDGNPT